jgi:hypothetical protein
VVRTERLMAAEDVASVLTHELAHVQHRESLGDALDAVPRWAREGLAMWIAEQGPDRLHADEVGHGSKPGSDPAAALLNGLAGPHTLNDYAEDWLAFAWLESTKGVEAVHAFARRLLEVPDAEGAFGAAAGMPFAAAAAQALAWSRARIAADMADRDAYLAAKKPLSEGKAAEAVASLDAFLAASPNHLFAPRARLDRAVALARSGRAKEALAVFDEIERSPWVTTFGDDILEQRARIAAAHHDLPAVEAAASRFLRDYSWMETKRLDAMRALWQKAGGTPPPPPSPDLAPGAEDDSDERGD